MPEKVAILSDIHGNSVALQAVMTDIAAYEVDQVFVLGDIINGVDLNTCAEMVRGWENTTTIPGNGEKYMLTPDIEDFPNRNSRLVEYAIALSL